MRYSMVLALCIFVASLAGCGGGGSGSSDTLAATTQSPNVMAVTVEFGPSKNVNELYTSVTICAPGSSTNCQTIDHVLVDTGSTGLRIFASELSPALALPQQSAPGGAALAECMPFIDGYTWGPIKVADIKLAGLRANSANIQVVSDPAFSSVPADCSKTGLRLDSADTFGAKGVLGVGLFSEDCGSGCEQTKDYDVYFACPPSGCTSTAVEMAKQVQNPVSRFASDNNGVVLKLPAVPAAGAATATGSLVFGIGTQANNALGAAKVIAANPFNGYITTEYKNKTYSKSFIDSGSNGIFFLDGSIPLCSSGFYCPPSSQNLTATNTSANGPGGTVTSDSVAFSIANADQLFADNRSYTAFSTLAGTMQNPSSFDWGLPFFFGRTVFTAIEGKVTPGGTGPYFAY